MTRSRYGLLAGIAGGAFAWWWRHRAVSHSTSSHADRYGETIYRNTPDATGLGGGPT